MANQIEILKSTIIFKGIQDSEIKTILTCMETKNIAVKKDEFVFYAGDNIDFFGIVTEGIFHIIKETIDGQRVIVTEAKSGNCFAEAICCAGDIPSPVGVYAAENSAYIKIYFKKLLNTCSYSCTHHIKLIENMLQVIARKNMYLQSRIDFLSKRTIRAKLFEYFESEAAKKGRTFEIDFNREELADFLCIDRSALSRELGNLKEEGIINYKKNKFTLI